MIPPLAAALAAALCAAAPAPPPTAPSALAPVADTTYRRLFESGVTMGAFLAAAKARQAQWAANYERGIAVPDALLTRARRARGPWKVLVVAVDGCSDSVNTVPYIARLAERLVGVELRIVDATAGRAVMEAHRTPDGRPATPTVVVLDAAFRERGCWIERPATLRDWILGARGSVADSLVVRRKMAWYDDDGGSETVADVVAMLERAATGAGGC